MILGAPIGNQIKLSNLHTFYMDKISKRISRWSNKLLFDQKNHSHSACAIEHNNLPHDVYGDPRENCQTNWIFKDFLWGFDHETRRRKTPLVAWSRLIQPRECGGMGLKDYMAHANALLNRWVARALDDNTIEWTTLFFMLIKESSQEQRRAQNRAHYTNTDRIMFHIVKPWSYTI